MQLRNDLSSAIHWCGLENTKSNAQTHIEWRQMRGESCEQRSIRRRNETRIELKLKRNNFTLFYHWLLLPRFKSTTSLGTEMSECEPSREEDMWRDRKTTCGSVEYPLCVFVVCSLPHCTEQQSRVLEHMCVRLLIPSSVSLIAFYHSVSFETLRRVDAAPSSLTPRSIQIEYARLNHDITFLLQSVLFLVAF